MQMYIRLIKVLLRLLLFHYKVDPSKPFERHFTTRLPDVDFNNHITNARYASFIDLVSIEFLVRTNVFKTIRSLGMHWMLVSSYKRYRRELRWGAKFTVRAQLVYIGPESFYMEYQFIKDDFVHFHAVDKFVLFKKGKGKISPHLIFPWADESLFTPPPHLAQLMITEEKFQQMIKRD